MEKMSKNRARNEKLKVLQTQKIAPILSKKSVIGLVPYVMIKYTHILGLKCLHRQVHTCLFGRKAVSSNWM